MAALGTDYISEIVQESFNPANDQDQVVFNKDFYKAKKEVKRASVLLLSWLEWRFWSTFVYHRYHEIFEVVLILDN